MDHFVASSSEGASSGFSIMWNYFLLKDSPMAVKRNSIILKMEDSNTLERWNLSNIYSLNTRISREELWNELVDYIQNKK